MIEKPDYYNILEKQNDVFDAWDSRAVQLGMRFEWVEWMQNLREWRNYITLTFREDINEDSAFLKWKLLVRYLNSDVYGNHYTRKVGHSYFSYMIAQEYQKRGVIHFHVITDMPLNFPLLHRTWNNLAGFAQTQKINQVQSAISYCVKYAIKDSDVRVYLADRAKKPDKLPLWWS